MPKTLLSLFDYSAVWCYPYELAGWNVINIDEKHGVPLYGKNIAEINAEWFYENIFDMVETVDGVLAAPPCTDFTGSGDWHGVWHIALLFRRSVSR